MNAQLIFLFPAEKIYEFIKLILGFYGFGHPIDHYLTVAIAILFWGKILKIFVALISRLFGFEEVC